MQYRTLGRSDVRVSAVAMGCWAIVGDFTSGPQDEKDALAAVDAALDAGINFFDTAEMYGDGCSEEILGRAQRRTGPRQRRRRRAGACPRRARRAHPRDRPPEAPLRGRPGHVAAGRAAHSLTHANTLIGARVMTGEPDRRGKPPAHRAVKAVVHLKDARGLPWADQVVTVRQTRHKFLFGCNIFLLDTQDPSDAQRAYQERFAALLNYATLPFYWGAYEKEPDRTDENRLREMAGWCREHHIVCKGHPLCWHAVPPGWHAGRPLEEMHARQMDRIEREVAGFRGLIDAWDVVNEAVIMPRFTLAPNHLTPLVNSLGVVPVVREAFARARRANPQARLLLNDYDHTAAYEHLIEQCLEAGVEIDAIGIQSHMHHGYAGNDVVRAVCERFARFGKPLHWTEASLISGDVRPDNDYHTRLEGWASTAEGEARQAEEAAGFYATLYAHPAVEAITWWDFRDGCWLGAPAGLLREDMSPKPAYERLMKLIKGDWWFAEKTLKSDRAGALSFSGPPGDYELTTAGGTARLVHDGGGAYELPVA